MDQKRIPFKKFLPGIAWFFIVAILTLMPGRDVPEVGWLDSITGFDKVVHGGLFGGLVFLFSIPYLKSHLSHRQKINQFTRITIAVILWGITIEFLQKYAVVGRDFELLDWAADSFGAVLALWLIKRILKSIEMKE